MAKVITPDRGPRNAKLTVLIPTPLLDDLRALRESTGQSTGDLVNRLLEAEISRRTDDLEAGREILRIKESRQGKAAKSNGQSSKGRPPEIQGNAAAELPKKPRRIELPSNLVITPEDVGTWADEIESTDDKRKRKADGEAFLSWIESHGSEITPEAVEGYKAALKEKYPNPGTSKAHMSRVNGLLRWAAARSRF